MTNQTATRLDRIVFFPFIAPPSAGKGTQANALTARFHMPRIDMGSLLRAMAQDESPLGNTIRERQAQGQLVDTPIVLDVFHEGIRREVAQLGSDASETNQGFILDGFPRNAEQAAGLLKLCEATGARIGHAIFLEVPAQVLVDRAVNRRMCPTCGEIYNLQSKPPQVEGRCDHDGAELVHRADDQPDKVANRLQSFEAETRPILDQFRQAGKLVTLDGNRAPDVITEELLKLIQPWFE